MNWSVTAEAVCKRAAATDSRRPAQGSADGIYRRRWPGSDGAFPDRLTDWICEDAVTAVPITGSTIR